jgi:hypothetical protein
MKIARRIEKSFFLSNQPDALSIQIYSVMKLHVSGILSAHHQEFSTVHSALVRFIKVFIKNLHETY